MADENSEIKGNDGAQHKTDDGCLKAPENDEVEAKLKVGGEIINVNLEELRSKPETMLGKMFTSGMAKANEEGEYEIHNVKAAILKGILDYYKNGCITFPANVTYEEMTKACDFLQIPFNFESIDDPKRFFRIKTEYYRTNILSDFFGKNIIPHIDLLAEKGISKASFYIFSSTYSHLKDSRHNNLNSFYVDPYLFRLIAEEGSGHTTNYLASQGFNVSFTFVKQLKSKLIHEHIICRFTW